ncbi:MAG: YihY/virulence factor BrkB family protein [Actinomycetota bacterium]|nr:YihY/virulence factor BrkB family protein [Actinomycetota bacterium]
MALRDSPVVATAVAVHKRYGEDAAGYLAATVTYYGFLSLFPLLLLALSVVGFVLAGNPEAQQEWAVRLSAAVPGLEGLIGENVQAVVGTRAGAGIIGLLGLLWTGTAATEAAGFALGNVFRVPRYESFLHKKRWSIAATAALGVLALTGIALVGLARGIDPPGILGPIATVAVTVVAVGIDFALFLVAYRILVQRRGPPFGRLWPGALVAAVLWTALKHLGAWYAANLVEGRTAVYGTFATAVGALLLLYLSARIFMYGAVLNAVLIDRDGGEDMARDRRSGAHAANGRKAPEEKSTIELVRSIAGDTATLVRKEVQLAKEELMAELSARVKGAVMLAIAGVFGLLALGFLGAMLAHALDNVMAPWLSRLIVTAVYLAVAGIVAAVGLGRMKRGPTGPVLEETRETVKEDVRWAREQLRR